MAATLGVAPRESVAALAPLLFVQLGVATGTDFADASLKASGNGFAVNFGAIWKVNDRLSIGGHWLTRKQIKYDGDAVWDAQRR